MKIFSTTQSLAATCTPQEGQICLLEPQVINAEVGTPYEGDFGSYAVGVFNTVLIVIVVTAILMMVFGGVQYAASALPSAKSAARDRIMGAIYGLLLALAAYLILQTVNPDLLKFEIFSDTIQKQNENSD